MNAHDSITIGLDLGNTFNKAVGLDAGGRVLFQEDLRNDPEAMEAFFNAHPGATVGMETGTHCRWIAALAAACGCEPVVGNARQLRLVFKSSRKNDWKDALKIAQICRADKSLFHPVTLRDDEHHRLYQLVRQRALLVGQRTQLVNAVRGFCKAGGVRLPKCDARSFASRAASLLPEGTRRDLKPLLDALAGLAAQIAAADAILEEYLDKHFPRESALLQTVPCVGPVTGAAFIALVPDPHRFRSAREAGPYFGLVPKQDQSGETDRPCEITREGNMLMRTMLVNVANLILRDAAPDTALKRFGLRLCGRGGGKVARRKAKVALARKLAVVMLAMLRSGEPFRMAEAAPQPDGAAPAGGRRPRGGKPRGRKEA